MNDQHIIDAGSNRESDVAVQIILENQFSKLQIIVQIDHSSVT